MEAARRHKGLLMLVLLAGTAAAALLSTAGLAWNGRRCGQ